MSTVSMEQLDQLKGNGLDEVLKSLNKGTWGTKHQKKMRAAKAIGLDVSAEKAPVAKTIDKTKKKEKEKEKKRRRRRRRRRRGRRG